MWNQELMNLPTRCCYVKVNNKPAVKITSLKMQEPRIDQKELAAVLGEYKSRYQRSRQEAEDVLTKEADRLALFGHAPSPEESADTVFDSRSQFQNPFAAGTATKKQKQAR
jgi:hypothetical protein